MVTPPFVRNDYGPLKRVLVNPPTRDDYAINFAGGGQPILLPPSEECLAHHGAMVANIERSGAEVIPYERVLDEAIEAARSAGRFDEWLRATFPALADRGVLVTGATLLARSRDVQYQRDTDGEYVHVLDSMAQARWIRDFGVMTPRGLILCNRPDGSRKNTSSRFRFAMQWSPTLRDYPMVFDAPAEKVSIDGGDVAVVDEKTLFVGVGHLTDLAACPLLARKLEMDVIAVQKVVNPALLGSNDFMEAVWRMVVHLDTVFGCIGPKHCIALPYLLEASSTGDNPLSTIVRGNKSTSMLAMMFQHAVQAFTAELGLIQRFHAGTGERDTSLGDVKIVDYVRSLGWKVSYVGGALGDDPLRHFCTVVLADHQRQIANVVATGPDRVVAFSGAKATLAGLVADGVEVLDAEGYTLWPEWGGPRCLTLPLERS